MIGKYGDEDGLFWLPAPGQTTGRGGKRGATGPRQPRIHVPKGPPPVSDWKPPTDFPRLHGVVAIDVETRDENLVAKGSGWARPGDGYLVGVSIAWEEGERYYPFAHEGGGNLDKEPVMAYIRDLAENKDVQLVCHGSTYDLGWIWGREGIKPANPVWDTMAAIALLDEYRQRNNLMYNLNACGRDYCNVLKDETLLSEAAEHFGLRSKHDLWRLHSMYVGPYGEGDAGLCYQLWNTVKPLLLAEDLWDIFMLEMRYTVVVTAMRMRGVRVDVPRAERFRETLLAQEKEWDKRLRDIAGFDVPVKETKAIEKAFQKLGLPYPRTQPSRSHPDGQASFTTPWLKTIKHPLAEGVWKKRRLMTVRTLFVEGFFLGLSTNGRVYPQVHPLPTDDNGTVSGRSSCSDPNLQQLSAKDPEMAREVRGLCLPEEGAEWAALDYSQQEPRLAVHFSLLAGVAGAKQVAQKYIENPRTDFHQMVADLGHISRGQAKILNLALIYGKGEAATCRELGFETEVIRTRSGRECEVAGPEGKKFLESYHNIVPFVSGLKDACKRAAKRGWIRTLLGRRCRFGENKSRDHTAVNRLVQGSAADQLKKANVDMYEQLNEIPLVNVHDEAGVNKVSDRQIKQVVECMIETTPLEVPVVVDVATGSNWGEAL